MRKKSSPFTWRRLFLKPFKTIEEQISTTWGEDMIQEEFKKVVG
jgi:hypothetical protein